MSAYDVVAAPPGIDAGSARLRGLAVGAVGGTTTSKSSSSPASVAASSSAIGSSAGAAAAFLGDGALAEGAFFAAVAKNAAGDTTLTSGAGAGAGGVGVAGSGLAAPSGGPAGFLGELGGMRRVDARSRGLSNWKRAR